MLYEFLKNILGESTSYSTVSIVNDSQHARMECFYQYNIGPITKELKFSIPLEEGKLDPYEKLEQTTKKLVVKVHDLELRMDALSAKDEYDQISKIPEKILNRMDDQDQKLSELYRLFKMQDQKVRFLVRELDAIQSKLPFIDPSKVQTKLGKGDCIIENKTPTIHTILLLDGSASMEGKPWEEMLISVREYLAIREEKKTKEETVSVIVFSTTSQLNVA